MRKFMVAGLVLLLVGAACSTGDAPGDAEPTAGGPGATAVADDGCPPGLVDAVAVWGDVGFAGAVSVVRGAEACSTAVGVRDPDNGGTMTPQTVFAIGSVSKSFTAAAIMRLVGQDRIDLRDTAGTLVPGLTGPAASATVAELLAHTSGVVGGVGPDHRPLDRAGAVAALGRLPREFPAGTDFGYTNAGYTGLALVIEAVTGDYRRYLARHVLRPGGDFSDAGFWDGVPRARGPRAIGETEEGRSAEVGDFAGPHWALSGNGDLAMSVPTLAAWTARLFRGQLLPRGATAAIEKPRWDHGGGTSETFGWVRYGKGVFGAAGFASAGGGGDTGHNAVVVYVPARDTAVAIASSTPGVNAEELMEALIPGLVSGRSFALPAGAGTTGLDPRTIRRAEGTYEVGGGGRLEVRGREDQLTVSASGDAAVDALFALPTGSTEDDLSAHEAGVTALLTGDDPDGEGERDLLADAVGGVEDVVLQGTIADHGELHTYVSVVGGDRTLEGWYALDDQEGVAAAQVPADPPRLVLDRQRGDTLLDVDPSGRRADVRVRIEEGRLVIDNGRGVVTATRVGE